MRPTRHRSPGNEGMCGDDDTHPFGGRVEVAMVQVSLRDEMVWRDGSAEADGWKPTAIFGGCSATKDMNQ